MHVIVFSSILVMTCGYALWRGGAPERWAAILFAAAAAASLATPFHVGRSFHTVERGFLAIDALLFLSLLPIALRANRFWPMWVTALQLLTIGIHGVKAYDPMLVSWIYNSASGKMSYPIVIMLAIGVARHRSRLTAYGSDPDWTPIHRKALTP